MTDDRTSIESRMTAVETQIGSLAGMMKQHVENYEKDRNARGDSGRANVTLMLMILLPVCGMGAYAINGPIQNNNIQIASNKADIEQRLRDFKEERERRLATIETRFDHQLELEQQRNNRIERELGGVEMINDLFMKGRLRLDQDK